MQTCKLRGNLVRYKALEESISILYQNEECNIRYKQWIKNELNYVLLGKFKKPIEDVLALLKTKLVNFLRHVFIKRKQANHFKNLKENLPTGTLFMQLAAEKHKHSTSNYSFYLLRRDERKSFRAVESSASFLPYAMP